MRGSTWREMWATARLGLALTALAAAAAANEAAPAAEGPALALVIDDVGHTLEATRRVAALPVPLTAAVLPYVDDAAGKAALLAAAGKEIFLHMPMQPEATDVDPGPIVLRLADSPRTRRALLDLALERVPSAVGINNHMGSRFTSDPAGMAEVVEWAGDRGLVFLDSRTSATTVGAAIAARRGLPHLTRDVFLDNELEPTAILARLDEAERRARRRGHAVAIAHPHPQTIAVLESWLPEARRRGLHFLTAGELARLLTCGARPLPIAAGVEVSGCGLRSSLPPRPRG